MPACRPQCTRPREKVRQRQALREAETRYRYLLMLLRWHDGTVIWVDDHARPASDANGQVLYYEGAMKDITEHKRAEESLQEAHDKLKERVRERTAELQRFVNLMAGREIRMAELMQVIRQLRAQLKEAGLTPVVDDPLKAGLEDGG